MVELYCSVCSCITSHEFTQRIPTYEEEKQRTEELYDRMESGEYGLFDVITAKVLRHGFVADIQHKVDRAFRDLGLDPGQDIEGKDMYQCSQCSHVCFI